MFTNELDAFIEGAWGSVSERLKEGARVRRGEGERENVRVKGRAREVKQKREKEGE